MTGDAQTITYRPDVDLTPSIVHVQGAADQVQKGSSGTLTPEPGEARVSCPKCGSPALALFHDDTRHGLELPGFKCQAGDCGYEGVAQRRVA